MRKPVKKPRRSAIEDRVSLRLPADLMRSVDGIAQRYNQTRTNTVEILLRRGLVGAANGLTIPAAESRREPAHADLFA